MKRVATVAVLVLAGVSGLPLSAAAAQPQLDQHSVTITVDDLSPSTPVPSTKQRKLTFSLTLRNNTSLDLKDLTVTADRNDPIKTEAGLDKDIAKPPPPTSNLVSPVHHDPVTIKGLAAGAVQPLSYVTTTSTDPSNGPGICLCYDNFIYPVYFTVTATDPGTSSTVTVGTTQTYFPSFATTAHPAPLDVSWVWPLLDRPHRLANTRTFLDDDLANEVAAGGRLDRALQVVENVAQFVPLTLVVDPDLLDELEVMASGNYRVRTSNTKAGTVPGIGAGAAQAWLTRFAGAVDQPNVDVEFTAFADPDVESLTRANLGWTPSIGDQDSITRVADALGTRVAQHDVAWPAGSTLSQDTLAELVRQGTSTVVVDDATLPRNRGNLQANGLAEVPTSAGKALAAVTSRRLESEVADVLKPGGRGLAALPELVSHLALRVLGSIDETHPNGVSRYVVLTPPRQLDVDPAVATRTILATARTFWTHAISITDAARDVQPSDHGVLHYDASTPSLPSDAISDMQSISNALPGLTGKYGLPDRSAANAATSVAIRAIDKIPVGVQRAASSELLHDPRRVSAQSSKLAGILDRIRAGVHLVAPAGNASYTLTSNDAPLPVTVANTLDVDAQVRVQVSAEDNVLGFGTQSVDVKVPANSTQQVRVPTHVDITGRINVVVSLATVNGQMAVGGNPLHVTVRNTALDAVGVAITTVAAVILAIAFLFRLIRALRWRIRRRNTGSPPPPVTDPLAP